MAEGTRLVLVFHDEYERKIVFSFPYVKNNLSASTVKNLMNTIIANGDIFEDIPTTIVSAMIVSTTENVFDLSE